MQILKVIFSFFEKYLKIKFAKLKVSNKQINDWTSWCSTRIKFIYLLNNTNIIFRLCWLRWINDASADWYHEVFICAWNDYINSALLWGCNNITWYLWALKAICGVNNMIYPMLFTYLSYVNDGIISSRCKTRSCWYDT